MRHYLLILSIWLINGLLSAQVPVVYFDFEGPASTNPVFQETSSKFLGVFANPHKDAVNQSDSIGLCRTSGTADYDGIIYNFSQPIDLRKDTVFSILVYHPDSSGWVRLQFDGTGMSSLKLFVLYDTPGEWQLLSFPVEKKYDNKIKKVTLVFDNNNGQPGNADKTDVEDWYFDLLMGPKMYEPVPPRSYYNTENQRISFSGFDEAVYEGVVANLNKDTEYAGDYAGLCKTGKTSYAGIFYDLPAPVDFSVTQDFQMYVYSDSIGYVRVQLEKPGYSKKLKLSVLYDTPGEWKLLTFKPSVHNIGDPVEDDVWTRVVLIFDDKDADKGESWYFDWLRGPEIGPVEPVKTYFDFDSISQNFTGFAQAVWAGVQLNPHPDAVNSSDSVGFTYTGQYNYSGIFYDLPSTVDFSNGKTFSMEVYSADSVGYVRVQLERPGDNSNKLKCQVSQGCL